MPQINLSRRGLIGSLLAAPVIIRTPGLLMAVKPLPATQPVLWKYILRSEEGSDSWNLYRIGKSEEFVKSVTFREPSVNWVPDV